MSSRIVLAAIVLAAGCGKSRETTGEAQLRESGGAQAERTDQIDWKAVVAAGLTAARVAL